MLPSARASAAIEILADIEARKRPAAEALKDWGVSHRFAGSGDRAAIGNLVFDCLRTRASAVYAMGEASPRALVLRTLVTGWGMTPEEVAALADGGRHAPEPLSEAELAGLRRELPADAPAMSGGIIRSGSRANSTAPSGPARPRRGRRSRGAPRSTSGRTR